MKRWTGNKEISQVDGWAADLIIYSNYSHNDWVLLIADSILSQSLGKGKGDRNLMAKLELLNGAEYDNIFKIGRRRLSLSVTRNIQRSFL